MTKILLIEDEPGIQELLRFNFAKEGFQVLVAGDGPSGLKLAQSFRPDLIVLDLMLPGMDGYEVCRNLRFDEKSRLIPILMLSARNELVDKVVGLEMGADDYMEKPFSPRELIARIKARLREKERNQAGLMQKSRICWGELEILPENYSATLNGEALYLTVKEFELLQLFMANPGQVFSREHLLQKIWNYDTSNDTRTVDVHVSNLRNKLQNSQNSIETVRGIGYRFIPQR
ncbi:MAG TPA: response regulator transcription factor [Verrucomicrobiae bacterium]|nr:response regulator transcription factor [Verrucomicrobiae bacterium]